MTTLNIELDLILIDDIRAASRQMVRELGFMDATIAATDYPPSAVHAILEIGMRGPVTSAQLADVLCLEKSSVSRMVRKLIDGGELKENSDADDARVKPLSLTQKGRRTLAALHDFRLGQVGGAQRLAGLKLMARGETYHMRHVGDAAGLGLRPPQHDQIGFSEHLAVLDRMFDADRRHGFERGAGIADRVPAQRRARRR